MRKRLVLLVDDARDSLALMEADLQDAGYEVITAASGERALSVLEQKPVDFAFVDYAMPGMSGFDVLDRVREAHPEMPVIIMTGHATLDTALEAVKRGAFDYLSKPFTTEEMLIAAEKATRTLELRRENVRLRQNLDDLFLRQKLVGRSKPMQQVFVQIARAAAGNTTVLIEGETGTGKDLVAQEIHRNSERSSGPFVVFNCSAYPEELVESELFGHEKGAFTGAYRQRQGRFELANGGSLFLDEVGELSLSAQAKLLRVLQTREFERVGGSQTLKVDVRIISATNRSLAERVIQGRFRQDLFFRLNVLHIKVPALRERIDDVSLLVYHFLEKSAQRRGMEPRKVSQEVLDLFQNYNWPGNVRELENAIEAAQAVSHGEIITSEDLPPTIGAFDGAMKILAESEAAAPIGDNGRRLLDGMVFEMPYKQARDEFERRYFMRLLQKSDGNVSEVARQSGIDRRNVHLKIKKHGLEGKGRR